MTQANIVSYVRLVVLVRYVALILCISMDMFPEPPSIKLATVCTVPSSPLL